ncbi:MAG: hypothetical protein ACK502_02685 [Alphaproteobacteria bacterium]
MVKPAMVWVVLAVYVALSLFVMGRYLLSSNLGDTWRGATVEQMVNGTAERPYVYRRLVPVITFIVREATPSSLQNWVNVNVSQFANDLNTTQVMAVHKRMFRQALEKTDGFFMRTISAGIAFACLLGFVFATYRLTVALFPHMTGLHLSAPIVGLLMVPALLVPTAFIYDLPALGLAAGCYYALAVKNWRWFFIWFVLACVNKETAIFLTIFYCLCYRSLSLTRREYFGFLLLQLIVFVIIRGVIYWQFMDNPGIFLASSYSPQQAALWLDGYGYKALVTYLTIFFLLVFGWNEKPLFIRHGITLFMVIYVAYFLFGRPGEYRVFLDVVPLISIMIAHTLIIGTGLSDNKIQTLFNHK